MCALVVLSPLWTNTPIGIAFDGTNTFSPQERPPPPPYPQGEGTHQAACRHSSTASCPATVASPPVTTVITSTSALSPAQEQGRHNTSATYPGTNRSYVDDPSVMLDPNELAAKGATLLHHLALWMVEERRAKEQQQDQQQVQRREQGRAIKLETSTAEEESKPERRQESTTLFAANPAASATRGRFASGPTSAATAAVAGRGRNRSDCDRPDSGFDSKDEEGGGSAGVGGGAAPTPTPPTSLLMPPPPPPPPLVSAQPSGAAQAVSDASSSSPEAAEMSRQSRNRQPLPRKRRMNHPH